MTDTRTWAPTLADLEGVEYDPPRGIRTPQLQPKHSKPRVSRHTFDGRERVSLMWDTLSGSTSASPAARHFSNHQGETPATDALLRELHTGLALPGTPSDYHFAIQHVIDALWKRRKEDVMSIRAVEELCLLDIGIIEAYPDAFQSGGRFYTMTSMSLLVRLYEHAGDLDAALATARRVDPFLNGTGDVDRLEAKRNLIAEEENL